MCSLFCNTSLKDPNCNSPQMAPPRPQRAPEARPGAMVVPKVGRCSLWCYCCVHVMLVWF